MVSVTPDRGEEAALAAPVVVTFDQPMDPATTRAAFAIEPKVKGEVKVQGNALTFSPAEPLKRKAEYQVTLAESATSAAGLPLQRPVAFKFTTTGLLEVTNTQPADGADQVSTDSTITVAFNRPVVPLVGTGEQASLPQPLVITPTLTGKGEWINTSIYRFTPERGLAASTAYTVTIPAGLDGHDRRRAGEAVYLWLQHRRPDRDPLAAGKQHQRRHRAADLGHLLDADGPRQHRGGLLPRG